MPRMLLIGLMAIGLAIRVAFFVSDPNPYESAGLVADHGEVARNAIVHGRWFVQGRGAEALRAHQQAELRLVDPSDIDFSATDDNPDLRPFALQMPGLAVLLAAVWTLSSDQDYGYLQVMQILIDVVMIALVYWISLRLFHRQWAALVAAGLYAVFLPLAVLTRVAHLDTWAVLATMVTFALLVHARDPRHRSRWLAAAAVSTACGVYLRPSLIVLPAAFALALLPSAGWRTALRLGAVPVVAAVVALAPWAAHNYAAFDAFIPTRTGFGQTIWEGLGEVPNNFGAILDDAATERQVAAERPALRYGTPAYDDYLLDKSFDAISVQPEHYGRVLVRRVLVSTFLLHNVNWLGDAEAPDAFLTQGVGPLVAYVTKRPADAVVTALAAVGEPLLFLLALATVVATWRSRWREHLLLIAVAAATILPYVILHVEARYLLPASFAYMILVGLGVDLAVGRIRRERALRSAPAKS